MNTDVNALNVKDLMHAIYLLYVEYVVKNPVYTFGNYIQSELFYTKLDELVKASPIYSQRNV